MIPWADKIGGVVQTDYKAMTQGWWAFGAILGSLAGAQIANLLVSLRLPPGSRVAAQVEKSPEALLLYLATLRAGYVFLPLNTAYQSAEIEYFIGNAEPSVVVCSSANFGWVSKIAFKAGTRHVFTLDDDRSGSLASYLDAVCVPLRRNPMADSDAGEPTPADGPLGALHAYQTIRRFSPAEVRF